MQPLFATSAPPIGAEQRENDILADLEALLDEPVAAHKQQPQKSTVHVARHGVLALFVLIALGATLAFVPWSAKDMIMTGRSVAYGSPP